MARLVSRNIPDFGVPSALGRRQFLRYSVASAMTVSWTPLVAGFGSEQPRPELYRIDAVVRTTAERMITFPDNLEGLSGREISQVSRYDAYGYGAWTYTSVGLPVVPRYDLLPADYAAPVRGPELAHFFTFSDIHITDKEAPNQLIFLQGFERYAINNTSIYSPVMLYTPHVLDAAMQTMNVLHQRKPFDFALSLGDTCNSTSYNELRWYLDVIDGKVIRPSSGAHLGEDTIDYQKPFQAVGLDKSIPWYQVMGNHDHFMIGSFPVDADPSLGFRESYVADTVWSVADVLVPRTANFPVLFNMHDFRSSPQYYMGVLDGRTPFGDIIHSGPTTSPAFATDAPKVAADPERRSLLRTEWLREFFQTETEPRGHGFGLVDPAAPEGFACYSFVPKADVPLKVIVLDNTQSEDDGSSDIHGHGYLDAARWAWLKAELAAGQAADQLMIIAAHIPIGVAGIGSEMDWWLGDLEMLGASQTNPQWWLVEPSTAPEHRNAVTLTELVQTLQASTNLLLWVAGHRHFNTVKAFASPDVTQPERGFWQVETSSLRDFPQQLRTFEIYLNSDYTVSVVTTNIDPAVASGTPAAKSRQYAIAVQQIIKNDLLKNQPNPASITVPGASGPVTIPLPTMDPTRPQSGDISTGIGLQPDPTIRFTSLQAQGVPYTASYNAELFKPLSPRMVAALKARYPQPGQDGARDEGA